MSVSRKLVYPWIVASLNALDVMVRHYRSTDRMQVADDPLELGHTTRGCPEEAGERTDRVEVKCVNCEEVGHRARDCPTPRVDNFACRNCK